jgi:glycogen operon protein
MLLMGDELRRTQQGNNNAYCQDNEISWLSWSAKDRDEDLLRFTRSLIALRLQHPILRRSRFLTGKPIDAREIPDVAWYDVHGSIMDWSKSDTGLTCWLTNPLGVSPDTSGSQATGLGDLMILLNPTNKTLSYSLPKGSHGMDWRLFLDTAKQPPNDIYPEWIESQTLGNDRKPPSLPTSHTVRVLRRSMMVWIERR